MIVWLLILGIVAAGISVVVSAAMRERRIDIDVASTANWLQTQATIQNAVLVRVGKYTSRPSFVFSYSVQGEYFSGRFYLKANQQQSNELMRTLLKQKFQVEYDPENPSAWYIADATISGCEIIQKLSPNYPPDIGPYSGDDGQIIDSHLDR